MIAKIQHRLFQTDLIGWNARFRVRYETSDHRWFLSSERKPEWPGPAGLLKALEYLADVQSQGCSGWIEQWCGGPPHMEWQPHHCHELTVVEY